jgi:hypothetical protein
VLGTSKTLSLNGRIGVPAGTLKSNRRSPGLDRNIVTHSATNAILCLTALVMFVPG